MQPYAFQQPSRLSLTLWTEVHTVAWIDQNFASHANQWGRKAVLSRKENCRTPTVVIPRAPGKYGALETHSNSPGKGLDSAPPRDSLVPASIYAARFLKPGGDQLGLGLTPHADIESWRASFPAASPLLVRGNGVTDIRHCHSQPAAAVDISLVYIRAMIPPHSRELERSNL